MDRDGSVLDYCRLNDITIQPWSPFQYGFFGGVFLGSEKYPELNAAIDKLAEKYGVSNTTIALPGAAASRAPAADRGHLMNWTACATACARRTSVLTRQEWYDLYLAAGNTCPDRRAEPPKGPSRRTRGKGPFQIERMENGSYG